MHIRLVPGYARSFWRDLLAPICLPDLMNTCALLVFGKDTTFLKINVQNGTTTFTIISFIATHSIITLSIKRHNTECCYAGCRGACDTPSFSSKLLFNETVSIRHLCMKMSISMHHRCLIFRFFIKVCLLFLNSSKLKNIICLQVIQSLVSYII